jgi:hypothetical protein
VVRAFVIIALVLLFIVGGLLLLRSSATPVPPDVLARLRKRDAERSTKSESGDEDDD